MSRWPSRLWIAGMLLALSGCASLEAMRSDIGPRVDRWAAEHEYERALDTIARVDPKHPEYAALHARIPQLEKEAANYAQRVIARAEKLAAEEKWQAALDTYEHGLDKLPGNLALREARDRFLRERDERIEYLELRLLISRGQQLVRELPVRHEIVQTTPNDRSARQALARMERESQDVAEALLAQGRAALEAGDAYLAQRCLILASNLSQTDEIRDALAEARKSAPKQKPPKEGTAARRPVPADRGSEALGDARSALEEHDLLTARDLLQEAAALQPDDPRVTALQKKLDATIRTEVDTGIERGRRLYSLGNIEGALAVWTPLTQLDPDNRQLNEHIERAKRVLANLRELESKEPSIKLPR